MILLKIKIPCDRLLSCSKVKFTIVYYGNFLLGIVDMYWPTVVGLEPRRGQQIMGTWIALPCPFRSLMIYSIILNNFPDVHRILFNTATVLVNRFFVLRVFYILLEVRTNII